MMPFHKTFFGGAILMVSEFLFLEKLRNPGPQLFSNNDVILTPCDVFSYLVDPKGNSFGHTIHMHLRWGPESAFPHVQEL